jgi:hypothetical protein
LQATFRQGRGLSRVSGFDERRGHPLQRIRQQTAPSSTNVTIGSSFDIDVVAEDTNLGGFDLTLGFNPALVGFTAAVPDLFLGDAAFFESLFSSMVGLDTVQISAVSLLESATVLALQGNAPGNSFRLAKLTLEANAAGIVTIRGTEAPSRVPEPQPGRLSAAWA